MSLGKLLAESFCLCSLEKNIRNVAPVTLKFHSTGWRKTPFSVTELKKLAYRAGLWAFPIGRLPFYSCSNTSSQKSWCVPSSHLMDPGAERSTACEILATEVTILTTVETKELTITNTAWPKKKKKKSRHLKKKGSHTPTIMLQRTLQRCVAPRPAPEHKELFHCQQVFF